MIISKTITPTNGVYAAAVGVEVDPLETAYFKAYGEPTIDLAGTFTYVPSTNAPPPSPFELNTATDIGAPPVAGSHAFNGGLNADEYTASGAIAADLLSNPGFFRRCEEVIGDWEFVTRLDNLEDPAADSFICGMAVLNGDSATSPGVFFGWGAGPGDALEIQLRQRLSTGAVLNRLAGVAKANPRGIWLKIKRESEVLTASYSVDNGANFVVLGTATLTTLSVRVGIFVNNGLAITSLATFSGTSLMPVQELASNEFIVQGGPILAAMRAAAPHRFSMDSRIDPEAKAKVTGWADGIISRLQSAKTTLMAKPNPTANSNVTTRY